MSIFCKVLIQEYTFGGGSSSFVQVCSGPVSGESADDWPRSLGWFSKSTASADIL